MVVDQSTIVRGLRRLSVTAGMKLMVHASLSSFGYVRGGAATVIAALQEAVGSGGTLMMPSFNHGALFAPGAPGFFDPETSPTTNGAIPDAFWRQCDVVRSLHPTHAFACWGQGAATYTRNHHRTLTVGPDSPLGRLTADGGLALLLGVDYHANTAHHLAEAENNAPCVGRRTRALAVRLADGAIVPARSWTWRARPCPLTDEARYGPLLAASGAVRRGRIGSSTVLLFSLARCVALVRRLLQTGMGGFPPCQTCPIRPDPDQAQVPSDWDEAGQCLLPGAASWRY
jgi:aminoglycoside 3-N-acetyltransferase